MDNKFLLDWVKKYVNLLLWPLENYYYHQYYHAIEVTQRTQYLWNKEWLWKTELEMLFIAAMFHDTWFIVRYDDNETIWATIASNYLKTISYSSEKINIIKELIISTNLQYLKPKNILEKIIKDADMDNIGRDDFFEKWARLKKELEMIKKIKIKDPDWYHYALEILYKYRFFTKTSNFEREWKKKDNIKKLKELITTNQYV